MRNLSRQKITIIALFIVVLSISIGFAAFSNTLKISSTASVNPNASDFSLVFSNNTDLQHLDYSNVHPNNNSTGNGSNLTIDNAAQGGPKLSNIAVTFNKPGQVVMYDLYIVNNGHYDAYLTDLVFNNVEGAQTTRTCNKITEGYNESQWATTESLNAICNSISVSVELDGTTYTSTSDLGNILIEKGANKTLKLTVSYTGDTYADGPMRIRLGSISLTAATVGSSSQGGGEEPDDNPWITERHLTTIMFDTVYSSPIGNIIFYSNGDFETPMGRMSSAEIDDMLSGKLAFVENDCFAFTDTEDNYLLVSPNSLTATLYISPASEPFNRTSIISAAEENGNVFNCEVSEWIKRGITSSYAVLDERYSGAGGDIKMSLNGNLTLLGEDILSSNIDSMIENGTVEIFPDGFSITKDGNSYLFVLTGNDVAMAYASFGSVTIDRTTIINEATAAETVFEYQVVRENPWPTRGDGIQTQYINFDKTYINRSENMYIEILSNGALNFNGTILSNSEINSMINSRQAFVYQDGLLFSQDGSNYYLFLGTGNGEGTLYVSGSAISESFTRQGVINSSTYVFNFTIDE